MPDHPEFINAKGSKNGSRLIWQKWNVAMHINQTRSSLHQKATSLYIGDGKPHPLAASFNFLFQTNINNTPSFVAWCCRCQWLKQSHQSTHKNSPSIFLTSMATQTYILWPSSEQRSTGIKCTAAKGPFLSLCLHIMASMHHQSDAEVVAWFINKSN